MVIKAENMRVEKIANMRGGKGEVEITHLLEKEFMKGRARLLAKLRIPPNSSVGLHKHEGEFEVFFILSGKGVFHDNGKDVPVQAGDVCFTDSGESHYIENASDEDLVLLAFIVLLNQ